MTANDMKDMQSRVENEGFEYAFVSYSHFPEIKDAEFHRLREAYLAARSALAEYIGVDPSR